MNILITGAGRGIGLATATKLSQQGHRVFGGVRNVEQARSFFEQVEGEPITPVHLDLTQRETILPAVDAVLDQTGLIHGLVNNAGISNLGALEDQPDDEFQRIMDTNFYGHYHLTRAVLPHMRRQRQGRIVMVSSLSGLFGLPGETAYCCSKFAMEAMAACLRYEVAQFGIKISVVNPSYTHTELAARTEFDRATPIDSPYREFMNSLLTAQKEGEQKGDCPETIANDIVSALVQPDPQYRYVPGSAAQVFQTWKSASDEEFNAVVNNALGEHFQSVTDP